MVWRTMHELSITQSILEAERQSAIFVDHGDYDWHDAPRALNSWLPKLFYVIQDGIVESVNLNDLFKDLCIINFNYDRCIGCRACMGACPYSARHFNWFQPELPPERISPIDGTIIPINPKVQRRYKGVVEKCTFCVHRIRAGNPVPRCVEVCPTRARHFGDLNDPIRNCF